MNTKYVFNPNSKTHRWSGIKVLASAFLLVIPGLQGSISPAWFPWILAGITVVDHVLRNITTTPITNR